MRRIVVDRLESLQRAGVMQLPKAKAACRGERRCESAAVEAGRWPVVAEAASQPMQRGGSTTGEEIGWQSARRRCAV